MKHINEKCKIFTFGVRLRLTRSPICILQFAILLSGCVGFQAGGQVQQGRYELLYGDPALALAHFRRAAEINPNYTFAYSPLKPGVWTYVGRAYYKAQKLPEARQALEQALTRDKDDALGRLYLGLVLARHREREGGIREIESGLKEIRSWFDYIQYYTPDGHAWDPGNAIRSQIETNLAMIAGKDVQWERLIAGGENIGHEVEKEIDQARRDARQDRLQDSDNEQP